MNNVERSGTKYLNCRQSDNPDKLSLLEIPHCWYWNTKSWESFRSCFLLKLECQLPDNVDGCGGIFPDELFHTSESLLYKQT